MRAGAVHRGDLPLEVPELAERCSEVGDDLRRRVGVARQLFCQRVGAQGVLLRAGVCGLTDLVVDAESQEVLQDQLSITVGGVQEPCEFSLRQGHRLGELLEGQSQQ